MTVRHPGSSTLVFNDLVFDMPHPRGFTGFVLQHLTRSSGGPRISRTSRLLIVDNMAALRADLRALAETPGLGRIIVAHHEVIEHEPANVLRDLAR